ncbi:MAG: glycosyltransferase [Bacteroidota bacterium]
MTRYDIPKDIQDPDLKVIKVPTGVQMWTLRGFVILGLLALAHFLYWFIDKDHIGYAPLFWVLAFAFGFRILKILHEWYHYVSMSAPERPETNKEWQVDMITTYVPGEPYDMLLETLEAMVNVRYPHKTYLCDEGNDPFLIEKCKELGVIHSYRGPDKKNAKAGNVNYCLKHHCDGEIAVILDPDHVPSPDFLDRVIPYFEDEEIGFVQCIQAYKNRNESFIAKGAAEQTYHFYGPMMMSMNTYGTVQAIGANCSFRRSALDSIGGHMPGLSEDMHTAMRLHAKGWKSVYVPEALTRGLVPATLSGYYQQQLKWSRGSFDLLVHVVPKLIRDFSWRQAIHYILIPLYFLSGLIGLIDIAVPILALVTARSPWHVEMVELLQAALPILLLTVIIRQYVQRFVLEEHERGFHFMGGALLFGTWWINLIGLIYTFFNVKVPYIPTPKDDEKVDEWKISWPNFLAIFVSLSAVIYGLSIDWSPYSMVMATYAGINVFMLSFIVIVSQQKTLSKFYGWLYGGKGILAQLRSGWYHIRHALIYPILRNAGISAALLIGMVLVAFTFLKVERDFDMTREGNVTSAQTREFYSGQYLSGMGTLTTDTEQVDPAAPNLVAVRTALTPEGWDVSTWESLSHKLTEGQIPLIEIQLKGIDTDSETPAWDAFIRGAYQLQWERMAWYFRTWKTPVVIQPHLVIPDSVPPLRAEAYRLAWAEMVRIVRNEGAWNVLWSWPQTEHTELFPGKYWVDYRHMAMDQYVRDTSQTQWNHIPLFLTSTGGKAEDLGQWQEDGAVHAVIIKSKKENAQQSISIKELLQFQQEVLGLKEQTYLLSKVGVEKENVESMQVVPVRMEEPMAPTSGVQLTQGPEGWTLSVDGAPFFIKGISYNPAHDWRDGFTPLTRHKLEEDFEAIKEMGANTIRRYTPGVYDVNILRAAEAADLKILYGFWFDPAIDYSQDEEAKAKYRAQIIETIQELRGNPTILGWNLGNETFFKLSMVYPPVKRVLVQKAYLAFIEELAQMVKELDPYHPVFASLAHYDGLDGALYAMESYVPSVQILSVNTHYEAQLAEVDTLMRKFCAGRPYLVSEFSPGGYWDADYTEQDVWGNIIEPSPYQKAQAYHKHWNKYIEGNQGNNLGGIAYCWQDRLEGTLTWFGITDHMGRKTPSYYALKAAWKDEEVVFPLADLRLTSPLVIPNGVIPFLPFRSVSANNPREDLTYEWKIIPEGSLDAVDWGSVSNEWKMLKIDLPIPDGKYRVHLSIYDREGNVVQASKAFKIPYP